MQPSKTGMGSAKKHKEAIFHFGKFKGNKDKAPYKDTWTAYFLDLLRFFLLPNFKSSFL